MAFEPGGFADKLGNRHEARWVAKQLLRLIKEEIRSVTVEAIGDDERGVDLWIEKNDSTRQAQQCKARNGANESWSISDLNLRRVLHYLQEQLDRDPKYEFAFVSGIGATLLRDICDSARFSMQTQSLFFGTKLRLLGKRDAKPTDNFARLFGWILRKKATEPGHSITFGEYTSSYIRTTKTPGKIY